MRNLLVTVRNYFTITSLHGFRFIAEKERHWTERLLWTVLCILSWVGSGILIKASWEAFQNNAVSFVVETTYLNTNTSFPAVSVCEEDNMARVYEAAAQLFGDDHDCNLDEILKEITYFRGTAYYIKEFCFSDDLECPAGNYSALSEMVRSTCEEIFVDCYWNDKPIDCCKHFMKTATELGPCFTFSGANEKKLLEKGDRDFISTQSNRNTGLPSLKIGLNVTAKVYLHPDGDVPFYNTMTTDILIPTINVAKKFALSVTDIENPASVRELTVDQRKCRFHEENYLQSFDVYSYSACVVECRRLAQMKVCNCTAHLMPKSDPKDRCNMTGILCLNNNYGSLSVQKTPWSQKDGLICDCLPGCNEPEYSTITGTSNYIPENQSNIEIVLDRFPSERYKRNVVRGRLDLVVSMGGAAGLFVGASLLSFVEIMYFFLFRTRKNAEQDAKEKEDEYMGENGKMDILKLNRNTKPHKFGSYKRNQVNRPYPLTFQTRSYLP